MNGTPRGERTHITFFGVMNAGKSSVVNAVAGKEASIVADIPGTTTDPVSVAMELGALGPVALCDTAGLDDSGTLGSRRSARSLERLSWTDLAVLVTPLDRPPAPEERSAYEALRTAGKPVVLVGSFADRVADPHKRAWLESLPEGQSALEADARRAEAGAAIRDAVIAARTGGVAGEPTPLEGLVDAGDTVLLVTPVDAAAPKGRLILPQAQALRDALDRACAALVVQPDGLERAYAGLRERPRLVVTDSQAFAQVAAVLPADQPLSSFSILYARKKGELADYAAGLAWLLGLAALSGSPCEDAHAAGTAPAGTAPAGTKPLRLLAIEACAHNRTHEDIATVKIPALLAARTGRKVEASVRRELCAGAEADGYDLAVLCGGCMATKAKMKAQLDALREAGVPALNFGIFLAWAHGCLPRALEPMAATADLGLS